AIRHHYDVGNDFYAAWLDPLMVYSAAMWDGLDANATLEEAQRRKLLHHARSVKAAPGMNILDIGCGWGGQLRMLTQEYGVAACTGLTLSEEQAAYVESLGLKDATVVLANWHDYAPHAPFDGIISVGAFEHFAHPTQSEDERRATYRRFFQSCHDWTDGRGRLSLQTIAYGTMRSDQANPFITGDIFPAAELPTVEDIVVASKGLFRILLLRDDGPDYARTCTIWGQRLRTAMANGQAGNDPNLALRYHRYLRLSAAGFAMGRIGLLRIVFDPIRPAT
ncbi:MAG: cyclopropane-fatty-acyl-phospholipid synthase family protein, partial [Sphingobium sp.]